MIAAVVHLINGNKRKERIAVAHGAHNPIVDQPTQLLPVGCLSHIRVLAFLSPRDVVYLDTALANHSLRSHFHKSLNGVVLRGPVNFLAVKWFQTRQCFMDILVVTSRMKNIDNIHALNKISELHLRGAADVSAADMFFLFTNCSKLVKFSVGCRTDIDGFKFDRISKSLNLLTLQVSFNNQVQDDSVILLLEKCPHLQVLLANDCAKLTTAVVRAAAKHCPKLQEISFNWSRKRFARGRMLGPPLLDLVYDANSCYCELFRACTELKAVDFYSHKDYSLLGGDISPVDVLTLAQHCTQLTHVRLSAPDCMYIKMDDADMILFDNAVVQLVQNNPRIKRLTLKNFYEITKVTLDAVASHLPHLRTFSIQSCGLYGEEDLLNIRTSCPKLTQFEADCEVGLLDSLPGMLQTFRVFSSLYLTDEKLERFAQHQLSLQTFSLSYTSCDCLTSTSLCVALSHWHKLRTFKATGDYGYGNFFKPIDKDGVVAKAPVVDDSVLHALIQNCPLLTTLDISGNVTVSNVALCGIAKLVHLKNFTANGCKLMEDSALAAIAIACADLVLIELSDCLISDAGVRTLALYGSHKLQHISLTYCMYLNNRCI